MQFKRYYKLKLQNVFWRVTEIFKIKWRLDGQSYSYTIKNNGVKRYFECFRNNRQKLIYWLYQQESNHYFLSLNEHEKTLALGKYTFPTIIEYQDSTYHFKRRDDGYSFSSYFESETIAFLHYECIKSNKLLVIEMWNHNELEIYTGVQLQQREVEAISPNFIDALQCYLRI